tara:strand:- start:857 stop:1360 length:504 start_codon:yes stop_codon:yes gene_type:complete
MPLNFPFKNDLKKTEESNGIINSDSDFSKAKNLFLTQKESCRVSIDELSKKTKISRNVLIAIENGWVKYLPEKTYLISMIKKIESELNLEIGSLKGLLTEKVIIKKRTGFKFINIDLMNSWLGSILYILFILLSILALNSQQQYLLKINSISTEPILIKELDIDDKN